MIVPSSITTLAAMTDTNALVSTKPLINAQLILTTSWKILLQ
jgi:hypothetical protein